MKFFIQVNEAVKKTYYVHARDKDEALRKFALGDRGHDDSDDLAQLPVSADNPLIVLDENRNEIARQTSQNKRTEMTSTAASSDQKKSALLETLQRDLVAGGVRIGATEFVDMVRTPLVAALCRDTGIKNEVVKKMIADFLETSFGEALLSGVLALVVPLASKVLPKNATAQEMASVLATELRVRGIERALQPFVRAITGPLKDFISMKIQEREDSAEQLGTGVRVGGAEKAGSEALAHEVERESAKKASASR